MITCSMKGKMKHILATCILVVSITSPIRAQKGEEETDVQVFTPAELAQLKAHGRAIERPAGFPAKNGKTWQELDQQSKITYLMGVQEGLWLAVLDASRKESTQAKMTAMGVALRLTVPGFEFSDLTQQVDKFYLDSANLRVPVIQAYAYIIHKMKGDSVKELTEMETLLRKTYNN
jgi:hypothetical protein